MTTVLALTKRNLQNFLRHGSVLFFSFLSIFLLIILSGFFLAPSQEVNLVKLLSTAEVSSSDINILVNSWIMAGILIISTITIPFGALTIMVADYELKMISDFLVSPVKRWQIALSYILGAYIVGIVITLINFVVLEIMTVILGGTLLSLEAIIQSILVICIVTFASTTILVFLTSFLKSINTFSIVSTIVGTGIGFLAGVFVPIGSLPVIAQNIMRCFPLFYGTVVLRKIFMNDIMLKVFTGPASSSKDKYLDMYGLRIVIFDREVPSYVLLLLILVVALIFFGASFTRFKKMIFK